MNTRTTEEEVIQEDDLLDLLRVSKDAILIGGQAIAFWVAYFGVDIPEGPRSYISGDADFLGFVEHVKRFSDAIGGTPEYPSKKIITALHGAVSKPVGNGRAIGVDVLKNVVGIPAEKVRSRAIELRHPSKPEIRFHVMEPIDCLVSRIENLRRLLEKQNEVGVWQAKISISICSAYMDKLIQDGQEGRAIRAATAILKLAGSAAGLQVFKQFGLDLIEAIPVSSFTSEPFKNEQFRRMVVRINQTRTAKPQGK